MSDILNRTIVGGALAALLCGAAQADQYHYINTPVGNRAADMAGAYTAVSDDPTGLFYNPAGIVYSSGSNMSASMNTFQKGTITYKDVINGESNWVRSSTTLLPNFFGIVQPLGKGVFGFSYAVPNSTNEDQDQTFNNVATTLGTARQFVVNFNNTDNTYNIGPSYAYEINDRLSVGGTLYFHYRHQQRINNALLLYSNDRLWTNEYLEVEEYGVKPVLGVMWTPARRWSLGATVSKVSVIDSSTTRYNTCLGADAGATTASCEPGGVVIHQRIFSDEEPDYPLELRLGTAWFYSDALLLSGDIIYHESVDATGISKRDSVVNVAMGGEYYLSPHWALRGGFFTDYAGTPQLQENFTSYNQADHIDLYGISIGISRFTRNSSLSLGVTYSLGNGKSQIFSGSTVLQDVDMENLSVNLAASYTY